MNFAEFPDRAHIVDTCIMHCLLNHKWSKDPMSTLDRPSILVMLLVSMLICWSWLNLMVAMVCKMLGRELLS